MSVSYTCPNPECGVTLKTPNRVQPGKSVKCPKCSKPFVPEAVTPEADAEKEPAGGTLKLADEPAKKPGAKAEPPKPAAAPAAKKPFADEDEEDDESIKKGYGVRAETEEEKEQAEKNKPKFGEVKDKFKKSARGPAMSLLVMPANILTLAGLLTCIGGLGAFVVGMWPLVFNDAPPGEEEFEEAIVTMTLGIVVLFWGAMVCFGASQMQELASYPWSMVGAVMAVPILFLGVFAIIMLQNPKVKAGFAEGDLLDEDEEDEKKDEDDDDDDEDEDDDEEEKKPKKGKKLAKKGGDDEDDE